MTDKRFHLAWFCNALPHGWMNGKAAPWSGNDILDWQDGSFLIDMARNLDRAGFDYIMIEDHVAFDQMAGYTARLDPIAVMPLMAQATKNLGIVGTLSTSFYHPYGLARLMQSLDHVSHGRIGWNVVTTSEHEAALAFGGIEQPKHDERYEIADEFLDVTRQLWDSWEPGAVVANEETGMYVDREKVGIVEHEGKWYKTTGALNVPPGPQGRPLISQAGSSDRGRDFGAKWADTILLSTGGQNSPTVMKEIRDDIRRRLALIGRDPDSVKILFLVTPMLGDTVEAAWDRHNARYYVSDEDAALRLPGLSHMSGGHDFSQYDLDAVFKPIEIHHEGHQGTFGNFLALADGERTLRKMIQDSRVTSLDLIGTPEVVADKMEEAMEIVGGDGFLIQSRPLTRRFIAEITDGLVPELQRRGLVRKEYEFDTLRENLLAF
ncbi:MAG: dibenzothiophene desulfurization enzyme [Microbacteriaceae bacterium]|nr:dibenzothiophene desulfurization enzyme [Microbacteriaceae bacterium]